MNIQSYKDLEVWQKSINLVDEIYTITKQFPKTETYALASQMQRAAVAIPSNIAEGYSRHYKKEYIQFLAIAYSSGAELETQLIISQRQYKDIVYKKAESLLDEVKRMLYVLISRLS